MAATAIETIPTVWDDERDNAFFRITASVFSCEFTYGAGALLASYDDDLSTDTSPAVFTAVAGTTTPSATAPSSVTTAALSR